MENKIFYKFITISSFFIILFSCRNINKENHLNDAEFISSVINNEYQKTKTIFPQRLLSHFPKTLGNTYITHTEIISPEVGIVRLDLTTKIPNNEEFNNLLDTAIAEYNSEDTCLLVVNRFAKKEKYGNIIITIKDSTKITRDCYDNKYPIPNFWQSDYANDSTECKLVKGFKIYVLEAKPGIYVKKKYLSSEPYMPINWKHGFSRGLSVSLAKNVVIYWVIVW